VQSAKCKVICRFVDGASEWRAREYWGTGILGCGGVDLASWPGSLKTLTRQAGRILGRRVELRFLASEPENSRPASGEDLSFVAGKSLAPFV
jgi:hypothetical protein